MGFLNKYNQIQYHTEKLTISSQVSNLKSLNFNNHVQSGERGLIGSGKGSESFYEEGGFKVL